MTDRKSIKRALISSVIAIVLCCAMLVGTTFAWFTDMVTTDRNIIQSGNLDAVLKYATWNAKTNTWSDFNEVNADTVVFDNTLWEPGHTEAVKFQVSNVGTLAFKYELGMQVYEEKGSTNVYGNYFKLSDYIKVGAIDTNEENDITNREDAAVVANKNINSATNLINDGSYILANDPAQEWVFVINMPTTVGNEANHLTNDEEGEKVDAPRIEFGVVLVATQFTQESDTYGTDYDAGATVPTVANTAADLVEAVKAGNKSVLLTNDVELNESLTVTTDLTIMANNKTIKSTSGRAIQVDNSDVELTLNGVNIDATNAVAEGDGLKNIRGINVTPGSKNVTINVFNSTIDTSNADEDNYGINLTRETDNSVVNLVNSTIRSFQNVNVYGKNVTVNVTGGELIAVDVNKAGDYDRQNITAFEGFAENTTINLYGSPKFTDGSPEVKGVYEDGKSKNLYVAVMNPVAGRAAVNNYGDLTIEGGYWMNGNTDTNSSHVITNYGTLTINGGMFGYQYIDDENGQHLEETSGRSIDCQDGTVTINGGSFASYDRTVYTGLYNYVFNAEGNGTIIINNATVDCYANGVFAAINGGKVIVNGGSYALNKGGVASNTYRMAYTANSGSIELNGGTYDWTKGQVNVAVDGNVTVSASCTVNWTADQVVDNDN